MLNKGDNAAPPPPFSKRTARRLIQRAFVLVGRDRRVREHLRGVEAVTLWVIEDWRFSWTVELDRGKIYFERRPAKRPKLTLTWRTAEDFFQQIKTGVPSKDAFEMEGSVESRRSLESVFRAFRHSLQNLLQDPIDEDGESLL